MRIKHRDSLLSDIAEGVKQLEKERNPDGTPRTNSIGCVEVVLHAGRKQYEFTLGHALDQLANDLFFDERGNWSNANRATVRTI